MGVGALYVCAVLLGNRPRWSCPFHPISLLLRKETGWSPKETRFWSKAEPDNDSDARELDRPRKAAITNPVRPGEGKGSDNHQPPPQVGRGPYSLPTGSAHANGGAAGVKKRFSLAARHRFFGQAPKKWGRKAGQGNDHHPAYRRTRRKCKNK